MNSFRPSGQRQVAAVCAVKPLLAGSRLQRLLFPVGSEFRSMPRRRSVFGVPPSIIHSVVEPSCVFHIDVNPRMRVDPFHLGNRSLQFHRLSASNSAAKE